MDKTQKILKTDIQTTSPKLIIARGVIQNLPEITGAIKEIYYINQKGVFSQQILQAQLDELNINKEIFHLLVTSLTDLSKTANADKETKEMYRNMIKMLFEIFDENMRKSHDLSNYLNRF